MSYRRVLQQADQHFGKVLEAQPQNLQCMKGCSFCCHGLFEIGSADVAVLAEALHSMPVRRRTELVRRAAAIIASTEHPNIREIDGAAKEAFFDRTSDVACPALNEKGECLMYDSRPIVCRTFGLPIRDGDEYIGDICDLNFTAASDEEKFDAAWDLQLEDPVSPEDQYTIPEAILIASRFRR